MTVRPITIVGHRALSQRTRRVREVTTELRTLVADMFETNDAADGAGLAAPQVGSRWRLFVYSCPDAGGTLQRGVIINPVLERFGGIDAFFNNAGIEGWVGPTTQYPEDIFDKVIAVNLKGVFLACKQVLPVMERQKSGAIVNLSSTSGIRWGGSPRRIRRPCRQR